MRSALQYVLAESGIEVPDGRPLHAYGLPPDSLNGLSESVRQRLASGFPPAPVSAAAFVFWASEYIRASFSGGMLSWEFVFTGLRRPMDRTLAVELVRMGLKWWGRPIRQSDAGSRLYLYSLMAEGGLPEALLQELGRYRRVVMGLLGAIEAEDGPVDPASAQRMARDWVLILPQAFRTTEFSDLLADLGLRLAALRTQLPTDLPPRAAERWLDANRPGWAAGLPLRISPAVLEGLVRPALAAERGERVAAAGGLATRELRRDLSSNWRGVVRVHDRGWLPAALLPDVDRTLRLRLLPIGLEAATATLVYSASPDEGGWRLQRFGRSSEEFIPLPPDTPLAFGAFADGRPMGEAVLDHGLPAAEEVPSLWRAAVPTEGDGANRLVPQPGSGTARAACLWILIPDDLSPIAGEGVALEGPELAPGGRLWRVKGDGLLVTGTRTFRVKTGADEEAPEARLLAIGPVLAGWRMARDGGLVQRGMPSVLGEKGATGLRHLSVRELRFLPGSGSILFGRIVEWVENGDPLVRLRLVCLPSEVRFVLREEGLGRVALTADGLPSGLRLVLGAGATTARGEVTHGSARIVLDIGGVPPGRVGLRVLNPATGASLDLVAAWPARVGAILDPEDARITRDQPLAADALRGWRVFVPESQKGYLHLELVGQASVALEVAGEVPLTAHLSLIRAMLAQGGPDAQVNLRLIVSGNESHRLEIRRYHDGATVRNGRLIAGLARDVPVQQSAPLAVQLIKLHAVDLAALTSAVIFEGPNETDLWVLLSEGEGPWLIQSQLDGRSQRAVAWAVRPMAGSTREMRIAGYVRSLHQQVAAPSAPDWDQLWRFIVIVGQGGDPGVADQVQALGRVPEAAVLLAMHVPRAELADALALDTAAPLFWPVVPVHAFAAAVRAEYGLQRARFGTLFESAEADDEAWQAIASRIAAILVLRPELAGHLVGALDEIELLGRALAPEYIGKLQALLLANSARLAVLAQEAARRFDQLPSGVISIAPFWRPPKLDFDPGMQPVLDAPLVAAEMALTLRPPPSPTETLTLINLRLADPAYFDAALPAALSMYREGRK